MLILHQSCNSICRFYHLYNFTWNHYVEISVIIPIIIFIANNLCGTCI